MWSNGNSFGASKASLSTLDKPARTLIALSQRLFAAGPESAFQAAQ